jgi:hypothetical protein
MIVLRTAIPGESFVTLLARTKAPPSTEYLQEVKTGSKMQIKKERGIFNHVTKLTVKTCKYSYMIQDDTACYDLSRSVYLKLYLPEAESI